MSKKINVMHVTFGMGFGGLEKIITNLCHYVDRDRYNMMVCCTDLKGPLGEQLEADGFQVFVCSPKYTFNKYIRYFEVARFLKENKVHIVHSHCYAAADGIMGGVLARTPIKIHTDHCKNYPDKWHLMLSEKIVSYFADEFVAVSNHTKGDLVKWERINPNKISVIYNGMNFSNHCGETDVAKIRKELGLRDHEKIIGSVGRVEHQKGYDLLIDSATEVLSQIPDARFIIVGDGSKEGELREQIKRLGLEGKVLLTGWRLDASLILRTFDLFVMTSNFEGMPIVLLEAMALGIPIITTTVGGIPEVVKDGENGLWLTERNPFKLASIIISLLSNDAERKRMGLDGMRKYQSYYQAEKMADNYMNLYEKYLTLKKLS